jgi:hypothetical protein
MTALACLTPLHDEGRRRFKVSKPTRLIGPMHVPVAVETERPEVTVGLSGQPFIRAVMQVNLLVRPARRAAAMMDRIVPPLPLSPLGRLQVPFVLGTVPGHRVILSQVPNRSLGQRVTTPRDDEGRATKSLVRRQKGAKGL